MAKGTTEKTQQTDKPGWQSRIVGTGEEAPDQLLANPRNWRIHPQAQQEGLEAVLDRVGWVQNVVVNRRTGFLVDGHLRVTLAMRRGEAKVPVVYVDLTAEEEDLVLATMDPLAGLAATDRDQLAALLRGIDASGDPVLESLLDRIAEGAESNEGGHGGLRDGADPDAVPDPPTVPLTQPGDIYILGRHRLLCGDSTDRLHVDRLMGGAKADMVFTDPPYGVSFQSNMSKRFEVIKNDDRVLEVAPIIFEVMGDDTSAIIWTSQQVYPQWRDQFKAFYKSTIIWAKGGGGMGDLTGDFAPNYEMALFCVKGRPSFMAPRPGAVWEIGKDRPADYVHPTQKPVALAEHGMAILCKQGGIVLDLFGGSGSTLIACETTGRTARLMELDPIYCDVIVKRWEEATGLKSERVHA